MANVMHVVYSETIRGAGLIEGGPYMQDSEMSVLHADFVKYAVDTAKSYQSEGKIDKLNNIKNSPVYIISG